MATGASVARTRQCLGPGHANHAAEAWAARIAAAELAGANEVAVSTDSIVDRLQRATALLEPGLARPPTIGEANNGRRRHGCRPSTRKVIAAWKARLAERTRSEANYLVDVLLAWQKAHNLHPDLSSVVRLDLASIDPGLVIDDSQRRRLERQLDEGDLRGRIDVRLSRNGSDTRLVVGDRAIGLPNAATRATMVDEAELTDAHARGRRGAIDVVANSTRRAKQELADAADRLDQEVIVEVERRLAGVEAELEELAWRNGRHSPTP